MILLTISVACLLAWLWLALAHDRFWRASERLDRTIEPNAWPRIVSIVPARNEADTIGAVIASLRCQDYSGEYAIILVDDGSTDDTVTLAAATAGDHKLTILNAPPLPTGWTGKLNAVSTGIAASQDTKYLLLSDADISFSRDTLRMLVAKAEAEDLALVSLMARLDARGVHASYLIPAFVYFFQKLYPFPAVNSARRELAAAAGGCMLVRADILERAGGIAAIKQHLIDDCALARLIKNADGGQKIWLGLAEYEVVSLRDNRSLFSIWSMVSRSAFTQLGFRWSALIATVFGMCLIYLAAPLVAATAFLSGDVAAATIAVAAWLLMSVTFTPTLKLYDKPYILALFLPLAGLLYTGMTIDSAISHARGKGGRWKGRVYPHLAKNQ